MESVGWKDATRVGEMTDKRASELVAASVGWMAVEMAVLKVYCEVAVKAGMMVDVMAA